jgi:hypothetical protein
MAKQRGISYVRIPASLFRLKISSAYELAILSLAVGFGERGLRMSNSELARLLQTDRRNIPRILKRLTDHGYLVEGRGEGRRVLRAADVTVKSPTDIKVRTERRQSDGALTSKRSHPYIRKEQNETETNRNGCGEFFSQFWAIYPKKANKTQARQVWQEIDPTTELAEQIVKAVERQRGTEQWQRDGGRYIPNPATWLSDRRWEDEADGLSKAEIEVPLVRGADGLTPRERVLAELGSAS